MNPVLLDTHVLSELVRARPDERVQAFVRAVEQPILSVLTLHELAYGAERVAEPERRARLLAWIDTVRVRFRGRTIDVDADVAELAGRLRAGAEARGRPADVVDALIAASALVRGAAVATRNRRDFVPLGVTVLDPWAA